MYYILMILCLVILWKAFFGFQWGKGIIIILLWASVGAGLLTLGGVGYALLIVMNLFLLKWLS